jgi:hypothetical protein
VTNASDIRYWYIEGFVDQSKAIRRTPIEEVPFRVGRQPGLELSLSPTFTTGGEGQL